jgi:putative ABC transport system permease protein
MRLQHIRCDIRLAWRGLSRAKAFSAAAILTMLLGIAGTTLIFSLIRGVLLRPLPVRDQARLIVAWKELRSSGFTHHPFGDTEIDAVGRASRLLEAVAGVDANGVGREVVTERGESSYVQSASVTGPFFQVLGVDAMLGRSLTRADDAEGAENVVVISHRLWTRRYGSARDVIGRRLTLSEQPFTIVGVMPPDVDYPHGVELWRTTHSFPTGGPFGDAARREVDLVARVQRSATVAQVTSELTTLTQQFEREAPAGSIRDLVPVVRPFEEVVVGDVRPALFALLLAVALVLLIATANVSNLLLMRGERRRREWAVHEALGASRGRIVRQVLAESLALTLAAATAGLLTTWWSLPGLLTLLPDGLPRVESVRVDATVVVFTVCLAFVACCLAGLAPALSFTRTDLVSELTSAGRGAPGSPRRHVRRALVIAQVALAVALISAAGLLTRSVLHLQSIDTGFAADRLVFVELSLPQTKYVDRTRHAEFLDQTVSQLEAAPAVVAATPVNLRPFSGDGGWDVPRFTAEGQSGDRAAANPSLNLESVYPNYFATFQIPLVRGRKFTQADRSGSLEVAIVSEDVADRVWPHEDPLGKRIKMGGPESDEKWLTVVGVAAPTRYRDLTKARSTLYLPAAQFLITADILALRTTAPVSVVASLARDRIKAVDAGVLVVRVVPFARMLDGPLARPRFNAFLLVVFGMTALLLSTIGLYAVMSAHVRQRDREIAVRIALGATSANVRRLVLTESLALSGLGATIGVLAATAATRVLQHIVSGVDSPDPLMLCGAALLLVAASLLASCIPMSRATRVDTLAVLRT